MLSVCECVCGCEFVYVCIRNGKTEREFTSQFHSRFANIPKFFVSLSGQCYTLKFLEKVRLAF